MSEPKRPTNCVNCGAALKVLACGYCGTNYGRPGKGNDPKAKAAPREIKT